MPVLDVSRALERPVAFPGAVGARLAAGMAELDAGDSALLVDELDQPLQRLDESIVPEAEIADGATAAPLDLGGFDHDKARAAGGELAGIHQVPVCRETLHGRILVH